MDPRQPAARAGGAPALTSPDNLELARSICAAWDRGDYASAKWADPDIDFVIVDGPAPGQWTGLAGMAEGWRAMLEAWDEFRQEAEGFREVDEERVLVSFRAYGRAKTSGLDLAQVHNKKGAGLFHFHDGAVTRFAVYFDRERALADLEPPG